MAFLSHMIIPLLFTPFSVPPLLPSPSSTQEEKGYGLLLKKKRGIAMVTLLLLREW